MTPADDSAVAERLEIHPTSGFSKRLARFISGTATKHFKGLVLTAGMTGAAVMTIHERVQAPIKLAAISGYPQASTPKERGPRPV